MLPESIGTHEFSPSTIRSAAMKELAHPAWSLHIANVLPGQVLLLSVSFLSSNFLVLNLSLNLFPYRFFSE